MIVNIEQIGQMIGALVVGFIGWKMVKSVFKTNTILAKENQPLYFSKINGQMSTFGLLIGGTCIGLAFVAIGMTVVEVKSNYDFRQGLKKNAIANHEITKNEYERIKEVIAKLPPEKQKKNMPALNKVKEALERITLEEELKIIDEYTVESIKKYGIYDVKKLKKESTFSDFWDSFKKYGV